MLDPDHGSQAEAQANDGGGAAIAQPRCGHASFVVWPCLQHSWHWENCMHRAVNPRPVRRGQQVQMIGVATMCSTPEN